jgi:hypothetical protein
MFDEPEAMFDREESIQRLGETPMASVFCFPPNLYASRHSLLPFGWINRWSPPLSESLIGRLQGLAVRTRVSLSMLVSSLLGLVRYQQKYQQIARRPTDRRAKRDGIITPLLPSYETEVLLRTGAKDLQGALVSIRNRAASGANSKRIVWLESWTLSAATEFARSGNDLIWHQENSRSKRVAAWRDAGWERRGQGRPHARTSNSSKFFPPNRVNVGAILSEMASRLVLAFAAIPGETLPG